MRRSTSISSALERALSITKSLMDRWEADAAAWSFALAAGETRTSNFSVRRSASVDWVGISLFLRVFMVPNCDDNVRTRLFPIMVASNSENRNVQTGYGSITQESLAVPQR